MFYLLIPLGLAGIVLVVVLVLAVMGLHRYRSAEAWRKALKPWKLQYESRADAKALRRQMSSIPTLAQATGVTHLIEGQIAGHDGWLFQCTKVIMAGQIPIVQQHRAAVFIAPPYWPRLSIQRSDSWKRLKQRFSGGTESRPLELEQAEFLERFIIDARDEVFSLLLLTPVFQERLLASRDLIEVWVQRGFLVFIEKGTISHRAVSSWLERITGYLGALPEPLRVEMLEAAVTARSRS